MADAIAAHHPQVHYVQSVISLPDVLPGILQPGDMALFLGAGNVNQVIPELLTFYRDGQSLPLSC
jgi:UDP-N-acetylmuramate--alanine ligase